MLWRYTEILERTKNEADVLPRSPPLSGLQPHTAGFYLLPLDSMWDTVEAFPCSLSSPRLVCNQTDGGYIEGPIQRQ